MKPNTAQRLRDWNRFINDGKESTELLRTAADELERMNSLLVAFGKADVALDESEDGLGCDTIIDAHANAYEAIKDEARRLAKEVNP